MIAHIWCCSEFIKYVDLIDTYTLLMRYKNILDTKNTVLPHVIHMAPGNMPQGFEKILQPCLRPECVLDPSALESRTC